MTGFKLFLSRRGIVKNLYSNKLFLLRLSQAIDWAAFVFSFFMMLSIFTGLSDILRGVCNLILNGIYTGQEFRATIGMPHLEFGLFKWDSAWWFALFFPTVAYQIINVLWKISGILFLSLESDSEVLICAEK